MKEFLYSIPMCNAVISLPAKNFMKPHVKTVILELLNVIRETENDDLTGTMQRLVCTYVEDVIPIAVEMMSHLVSSRFCKMIMKML